MQEIRFTTEFCLSEDQFQKLIREKVERNERFQLRNKMKVKRTLES
jgi:metal-sulfur cluster biosynthetic enzyme